MCGICGFNWTDEHLIERMKETLVHRGPDAEGSYVAPGISLGHRRLSIVDLSTTGRQPLSNEDGTVWITFNGEIYNHAQLRTQLERAGHVFRSRTDTEAIVHAYEQFGLQFVEHLTGMFALAIWDAPRRRLVLARDRLGIKPLYYSAEGGRIRFASEIKALLADPQQPRTVNSQALFDLVGYEFTPAPETLFAGIRKLLPGCLLILEGEAPPRLQRYWSLEARAVDASPEALCELLQRSCSEHLMSDVPLGAFLSGGIDSSSVVSFLSESVPRGLQTFALGYREASFSEFEYARRVAAHFQTQHRELLIKPVDAHAIERSVWHLDEPTTDPSNLPFMLICEEARRLVKVALSGDGGDELLMGYDRFRASKAAAWLARVPLPSRRALYHALIRRLSDNDVKKGPRNVLKRFLQGAVLPAEGAHLRWQYFLDPRLATEIFTPELLRTVDTGPFTPLRRWSEHAPRERGAREQYLELNTILPDSVLMKVDKMSMAHGLEVRPPFLDHRVVEYCYSLPTSAKLHGFTTKWLLKRAMHARLPEGIATRAKQGFSIPMKNWIRGELLQLTHDSVFSSRLIEEHFRKSVLERLWNEHQQLRHNHSHLFWTLLNVSLWERLLLTGPRPAARQWPWVQISAAAAAAEVGTLAAASPAPIASTTAPAVA
ncbi:MAG TPA: asparagine synthase (glutamine-hydrolyzing) [Steroidobacteraceae bacterium]|nr:asparagine synthase (glutamine-hydrolyzing) [Steroidobacteraceae bacterium]